MRLNVEQAASQFESAARYSRVEHSARYSQRTLRTVASHSLLPSSNGATPPELIAPAGGTDPRLLSQLLQRFVAGILLQPSSPENSRQLSKGLED